MQYNLVKLTTLAIFITELNMVIPGLPANRHIYLDSDKMVRFESKCSQEGRAVTLKDHILTIPTVLDGPNVKS